MRSIVDIVIHSMKIITNQISLTKTEYFKILLLNALRNRWFVFLIALVICFLGIKLEPQSIIGHIGLFILVCLGYGVYLSAVCSLQTWILRGNQFLFAPWTFEIDHEFITAYLPDGSSIKINFSRLVKTVFRKNYFLIYYSRNQFFYLPVEAMSEIDKQTLLTLIKVKSK